MNPLRKPGLAFLALLAGAASFAAELRDPYEAKAREVLTRVVSFQTSIGRGQVPAMAQYLAGEFRAAGFPDDDIDIVPLGETASLVVRYRGDGSGGKPIALLAHMDVVTARREDWTRDPFKLVEENGYFFGRGVYDNKSGLSALTATFLRLKAEGFKPSRDLILVFTGDEETEGTTTQSLLKDHRELVDAEFALNSDTDGGVVGEEDGRPLLYRVQGAEKTFASFELTTHNPGGHSSQPRADNAIYELAAALRNLQAYRFPVMANDWTLGNLAAAGKATPGKLGEAMRRFARNPKDAAAAETLYESPAHVGITRTTCVPTLLKGGHADNALPQSATATVNCRIFPGVAVGEVQARLQRLAGPEIEVTLPGVAPVSDASPMRADVMEAVTKAVRTRHPGVPIVPYMSVGATDGVFFRAAGIPSYGVGHDFIKDSDDFSHGLNERLPVQSFYDGLVHWRVLLNELAGPRQAR